MAKRLRLTEKHPLYQKIEKLFQYMDDEKIEIHHDPYRGYIITDRSTPGDPREFELKDAEDTSSLYGDSRASIALELPPMCEWKILRDVEK